MGKLLHLSAQPASGANLAGWACRVLGALQACRSGWLKGRLAGWDKRKQHGVTLGDLALAVQNRLAMAWLVACRLDRRLSAIGRVLQRDRATVEECPQKGKAYRFRNRAGERDLVHECLVDFDALAFETTAAFEITAVFITRLFRQMLGNPLKDGQRRMAQALEQRGVAPWWVDELSRVRNLLSHGRTAWLAVEVKGLEPLAFDPVFLTKDLPRLEDDPERVSIEQCRSIWQGFVAAYEHLEAWLKEEVAASDRRMAMA